MNIYRLINLILAGVLTLIFSYSGFFISFFPESGLTCDFKRVTGLNCGTCGFTRDFNTLLTFSSDYLINPFSIYVFVFLLIQFFWRLCLIVFHLDKSEYKKTKIADILISICLFLIAFIPVFVASIKQSLALF